MGKSIELEDRHLLASSRICDSSAPDPSESGFKAAYKTGDATVIPLIPPAMAQFEAIPRPAEGEHLIPTTAGRHPIYTVTRKALIRVRRSVAQSLGHDPEHWTLHDLRRTLATHMARLGVDDILVERVLGHRIGGAKASITVTAAWTRSAPLWRFGPESSWVRLQL